jgi:hypothetical protein
MVESGTPGAPTGAGVASRCLTGSIPVGKNPNNFISFTFFYSCKITSGVYLAVSIMVRFSMIHAEISRSPMNDIHRI